MSLGGHDSGPFIEFVFFIILSFNYRGRKGFVPRREGFLGLSRGLGFPIFFFSGGNWLNARWTQIFHWGIPQGYAAVVTPE